MCNLLLPAAVACLIAAGYVFMAQLARIRHTREMHQRIRQRIREYNDSIKEAQ